MNADIVSVVNYNLQFTDISSEELNLSFYKSFCMCNWRLALLFIPVVLCLLAFEVSSTEKPSKSANICPPGSSYANLAGVNLTYKNLGLNLQNIIETELWINTFLPYRILS